MRFQSFSVPRIYMAASEAVFKVKTVYNQGENEIACIARRRLGIAMRAINVVTTKRGTLRFKLRLPSMVVFDSFLDDVLMQVKM